MPPQAAQESKEEIVGVAATVSDLNASSDDNVLIDSEQMQILPNESVKKSGEGNDAVTLIDQLQE